MRNTGSTDLANVVVADSLSANCERTIEMLRVAQTRRWTCATSELEALMTNEATVSAQSVDISGAPVIDPRTGDPMEEVQDSDTAVADPVDTATPSLPAPTPTIAPATPTRLVTASVPRSLSSTGSDPSIMVKLGLALLVIGLAARRGSRRRR